MSRTALVFLSAIIGGSIGALAFLVGYGLDWVLLHTCLNLPWALLATEGGLVGVLAGVAAAADLLCFKRIMALVGVLALLWGYLTFVGWLFEMACYIWYAPSYYDGVYHVSGWEHLGEFIGTIIGVAFSIVLVDQVWKNEKDRLFLLGTELSR